MIKQENATTRQERRELPIGAKSVTTPDAIKSHLNWRLYPKEFMNPLQRHLHQHQLDPRDAMNALMDAGLVSDNAVWPEDVAEADCKGAVEWMMKQKL